MKNGTGKEEKKREVRVPSYLLGDLLDAMAHHMGEPRPAPATLGEALDRLRQRLAEGKAGPSIHDISEIMTEEEGSLHLPLTEEQARQWFELDARLMLHDAAQSFYESEPGQFHDFFASLYTFQVKQFARSLPHKASDARELELARRVTTWVRDGAMQKDAIARLQAEEGANAPDERTLYRYLDKWKKRGMLNDLLHLPPTQGKKGR